ncbi:MAG: radical SAM protein [Candidatus Marsarchaeota archaeon]|nr:radical SAM protein [Candidatus Marsarchaeota archaeon]MCL5106170.1 radical SAM protein [Candidatus Marsarchaeota archaeon]
MFKQLAKIGSSVFLSNFTLPLRPYKLNFCITYNCNSRCKTCNIWKSAPKNELSLGEITQFAEKNISFSWIEFTGGEVFLRQDFTEIIRAFNNASHPFLVTFPTNCLASEPSILGKIDEILGMGIPKVAITLSLDGNEAVHDFIRGVPGNFKKTISLFRRLREMKKTHRNLFIIFGYTLSKYNQGRFKETFEAVRKLIPDISYNDFHINIAQASGNYYGNEKQFDTIMPDAGIAASEIAFLLKNRKFELSAVQHIESKFLNNLILFLQESIQPMKSRSMIDSLFLDSYGNVYPSIMWNKRLGNIRETGFSLRRIWNSKAAIEVRDRIAQGKEPLQWTSCEAYQSILSRELNPFRP